MFSENAIVGMRGRYIGAEFDVNEVGFVPWKGTGELIALAGPRWYFSEGSIRQILVYGGVGLNYEKVDAYTDRLGVLGFNMPRNILQRVSRRESRRCRRRRHL
jgi:hypothetical protein